MQMPKLSFFLFYLFFCANSHSAIAAMFHTIDTTSPLLCTFSYKFQNRVMVVNGKIQKVIASDEDRLSIFTEPFSGQIFISTRNYAPQETTVSIVTDTGVVQDLQISFTDRISEVVLLTDSNREDEEKKEREPICIQDSSLKIVEEVLKGNVPNGYLPCRLEKTQWSPKKGILLQPIVQLEGFEQILYLYQVTNTAKSGLTVEEIDLSIPGCRWVFLEANFLYSKQKMLGIIAVDRDE